MSLSYKYRAFALLFILALGCDLGSKGWARRELKPKYPDVITVVPGYFEMRYSENTGSAFGMFRGIPGARKMLFAVGIGALCILGFYLWKTDPDRIRLGAELGLLAGGTLGNVIDRFQYGKVTDFIVWKLGAHEWPTFNIADAALVIGLIGIFFDMPQKAAKANESVS